MTKQFCKRGHDVTVVGRYAHTSRGSGSCKACTKEIYSKKHPSLKESFTGTPEQRYERIKRRTRESHWKNAGIKNADGSLFTCVDFDRLYQLQQGSCAICKKHQSAMKRTLDSDHDHKTGKIRGLLCESCNKKLGVIENTDFVVQASIYLTRGMV